MTAGLLHRGDIGGRGEGCQCESNGTGNPILCCSAVRISNSGGDRPSLHAAAASASASASAAARGSAAAASDSPPVTPCHPQPGARWAGLSQEAEHAERGRPHYKGWWAPSMLVWGPHHAPPAPSDPPPMTSPPTHPPTLPSRSMRMGASRSFRASGLQGYLQSCIGKIRR